MNKKISEPKRSVLDVFRLQYEDIKFKKPNIIKKIKHTKATKKTVPARKTAKWYKKVDINKFIVCKYKKFGKYFSDVVNKVVHPSKKAKKLTKIQREMVKIQRNRGIMGIGLLLVVVSIAYSTTVILLGVSSIASKIALLPQIIFAAVTIIIAFYKLYK
jgi:hypothetical protein